MTFHDQIAYNEVLNKAYPPTVDNDFIYLLGKVDASIEITHKLEAIEQHYRGTIVQVVK